jgi:hypothetical protein
VVAQQSCAANSNFQRYRLTMRVKQTLSAALDRWLRQPSKEESWSHLRIWNPSSGLYDVVWESMSIRGVAWINICFAV